MAKCLFIFVFALTILVVFSGCPTVDTIGDDDLEPEPAMIESEPVESIDVEPVEPEPNEVKFTKIEPDNIKPATVESDTLISQTAESFHDKCVVIFDSYVNDKGMVDYKTLRRKRLQLKAILAEFDNLDPDEYKSWLQEDKIAFWINVFNLQKLKIVTDNYPITPTSRFLTIYFGPLSIRHIETQITRHKFLVMDEEFTFGEIEKRFFRKEFNDPRILLALSDASLSSPPLRNEPYYGYKLDEQLDDQAKRFLAGARAFRIDREDEKVYLSAIFQAGRYGTEFLKKFAIDRKFKEQQPATRAVLNFITNFVSEQDVSFLEVGNYTVKFMKYDWTINDDS